MVAPFIIPGIIGIIAGALVVYYRKKLAKFYVKHFTEERIQLWFILFGLLILIWGIVAVVVSFLI